MNVVFHSSVKNDSSERGPFTRMGTQLSHVFMSKDHFPPSSMVFHSFTHLECEIQIVKDEDVILVYNHHLGGCLHDLAEVFLVGLDAILPRRHCFVFTNPYLFSNLADKPEVMTN